MKLPSLRWQPLILGMLFLGTLATLAWSVLFHFGSRDPFMAHAHCYLLKRDLILLHGVSDFFIGASYVSISATLTFLVLRARREIPFHWMMLAFATFIVACGGTHFMEVWTLQADRPPYWFAGDLKLVTAFASLATACLLPPLVPKILRLLSEARLSSERKDALEIAHRELGVALERVKHSDQLKTNFFANISHELRTPVTLIVGPVDHLLARADWDDGVRHELQVIRRNALLLHKHVNDLLEVSRLEAGKVEMHYARADLARLVRLVVGYFSSSATNPLDLELDCPEALWVEMDTAKIERVLLNLISNAHKFTPEGGKVNVTVRAAEEGPAEVIVSDTGPGVPPELREAIFERFNQGVNPTSRGGAGTGLGLSIVREFAELHHGTVTVSDRPGGGAVFTLRLPKSAPAGTAVGAEAPARQIAVPQVPPPVARKANPQPKVHPLSPPLEDRAPLVLLVEDNPDMSDHIERTLDHEYRLIVAREGGAALQLAEAHVPDLILSDLMMPGMGGDELLREVRRRESLKAVPMMLLTARADDEVRLDLLRSGAQDFLLKPFGAEELRVRVRNLVVTKQVRDTLQTELASQEQDLARLAKEVTQRARQLERAKEVAESANRAKDQFLAVLSHELRTPLTPALATAMNLEHRASLSPEELRASLRIIRRNIELEARLIDDLLDLTRISRGKLQVHFALVDAHEAIRSAVEMCQSEIMNKGTRVQLELAAERFHLQGDAPRLLQVVWNLLLNAVKFTPAEGAIVIRTSNSPEERLVIDVEDSGIGIPPENLTRIFEPFEQGEDSSARRFGGLGLGLAVARGLVVAHGGSIHAQSAGTGQGATFRIEFETVDPPPAEPFAAPAESGEPPPGKSLRILLVEDHEDTRHAMERLLRRWGHTVRSATCVREARVEVAGHEFDLLVSDLGLPDGQGTEIMAGLRGAGSPIVGVAMSGFGMEEDIRRSHESGFEEHLTKPIAAQQLRAIVEQIAHRLHA